MFFIIELVKFKSLVHSIKMMEFPSQKNRDLITMLFDISRAMGDNDHGTIRPLLEELHLTLGLEPVIPHRHDLVDQIAVELDDHRDGKGQAGLHARGIFPHGLSKVRTQLRKLLNEGDFVLEAPIVNPADEIEVIQSGELFLKRPSKGNGPRNSHSANDFSPIRTLSAADEPDQGRFPCSVTPQNPDFLSSPDIKMDMIQYHPLPSQHRIALHNILDPNHTILFVFLRLMLDVPADFPKGQHRYKQEADRPDDNVSRVVVRSELATEVPIPNTLASMNHWNQK